MITIDVLNQGKHHIDMYLLNKIDKYIIMDKIMLRIKKKFKSWKSVPYFEPQL